MKRQAQARQWAQLLKVLELKQQQAELSAAITLQRVTSAKAQQEAATMRAEQAVNDWRQSVAGAKNFDPARAATYSAWAIKHRRELDALLRDVEHLEGEHGRTLAFAKRCQAQTRASEQMAGEAKKAVQQAADDERLAQLEEHHAAKGIDA